MEERFAADDAGAVSTRKPGRSSGDSRDEVRHYEGAWSPGSESFVTESYGFAGSGDQTRSR